jgi:hypothetical protein
MTAQQVEPLARRVTPAGRDRTRQLRLERVERPSPLS